MSVAKGQRFGDWVITSDTAAKGGNSRVWEVQNTNGDETICALKLLNEDRFQDPTLLRYRRFIDEVNFVKSRNDPDILPIVDSHLPIRPTLADRPWYVMPFAQPISALVTSDDRLKSVVSSLAPIASALARLHGEECAHRDIKPDNILVFERRPVLSDFGLVDYPGKMAITLPIERMGPAHFIAPELMGDAADVDARPGDVYSLAKTLWVLAAGKEYPPLGHIEVGEPRLRLSSFCHDPLIELLDYLLDISTLTSPEDRPPMAKFASEITRWLELSSPSPKERLPEELASEFEALSARHSVSAARVRDLTESPKITFEMLKPDVEGFVKTLSSICQGNVEWDAGLIVPSCRGEVEVRVPPNQNKVSSFDARAGCHCELGDGNSVGVTVQVNIVTLPDEIVKICVALFVTTGQTHRNRSFTHGTLVIHGGPKLPMHVKKVLWATRGSGRFKSIELATSIKRIGVELDSQLNGTANLLLEELKQCMS